MANPMGGNGVRLHGYHFEDFQFTVLLSGSPTTSDINKALTQDLTAKNTYKLAGSGDPVDAFLVQVEDRTQEGMLVGTAAFRWGQLMPVGSDATSGAAIPAVGGVSVVGSTEAGKVKGTAKAPGLAFVSETKVIGGVTYAVVCKF